mmetsp:Transcript_5624/g.10913  ORF Transcript_5624/g.10913 Transcript_5624/m.10913 type:complete len:321 (-) Transcript_5624:588-1550(-)|eukprot:CAMPEP_0201668958 /NCGR_PEP_ID=MMETSP0494-20130426/21789_1 /ASSEMBLY_ACC=CAM_ASM_000839 /TAXON_ID=420259 /ORGANISM="Thalassiosira gravida, Strain GMp14c1" /LENGTH=320 /DNA_ID=CAMNT_0048149551 /DNA_START=122 /DNA_END=1084 /DNA_ORIENTATION=-
MPGSTLENKLIAVMGATGLQGGAVVDALLAAGHAASNIRAITRNPTGAKAAALADKGIQVVQGDADDEASMVKAFENAYGAFLVTNFWADMSMAHEMAQTKTLQNAVLAANVTHVILSTLEDTRPIIHAAADKDTWTVLEKALGSYVPHFDGKGAASKEFLASAAPTTLLYTSFYYDNFINFGMGPKKHAEDQPAAITFPTGAGAIPMCSVPDIGRKVVSILNNPETINTEQGVVGAFHTGQEIADLFSKSLGTPVVFNAVEVAAYAAFGFPGAADLANMFRFMVSFKPTHRDVASTQKCLDGKLDTLEEWIETNKAAFQ